MMHLIDNVWRLVTVFDFQTKYLTNPFHHRFSGGFRPAVHKKGKTMSAS